MAMTNAERQRRFKQRRIDSGLVKKTVWTDRAGLLASAAASGAWASMTKKELDKALCQLLQGFEDWQKEVMFAEIFEYAKRTEKKLKAALELGSVSANRG